MTHLNESYDEYPRVVAKLNDRWRVIECRDQIQWILQCRISSERAARARWEGLSYCQTSEALIRCCNEERIEIEPGVLDTLFSLPVRLEDRISALAD
jgi:hypothetical protein